MFSHPPLLFLSVSRPDKIFFPPANWKVTKSYGVEQDVGPAVEHVYEVISHSCADSLGLSRLGWKADPTVLKAIWFPRQKEKWRKRSPGYAVTFILRLSRCTFNLVTFNSALLVDLFVDFRKLPDVKVSAWEKSAAISQLILKLHKKIWNYQAALEVF